MSSKLTRSVTVQEHSEAGRISPQGRRRERKWLARQDLLVARLAELHLMRELVCSAGRLVGDGWLQHAWFAVIDSNGRQTKVTAHNLDEVSGRQLSGVCLIGAVVHSAGGPAAVHTQLVQRTFDLTWHTLHEHPSEPVRWCPSPAVRTAHIRDLTRWNDHPRRSSVEVAALLERTARNAEMQRAALRSAGVG